MKKLLCVVGSFAVAMGVLAWSAQAADAAKPDRKQERRQAKDGAAGAGEKRVPGQMLERLRETAAKLDLSADQKTKITGFIDEAKAKLKELRETAKGDREKAKEQLKTIVQETREKVLGVLTDEQKAKLKELIKEHRGEGPKPGKGRKGADAPPADKPAA